jgi:glycosyltransferase involved in cell wall biosynthesis
LRFCKRNENHHRARRISAGSAGKWLARLHPEKGVNLLVEAFARLRRGEFADWKLLIVGSTDSREGGEGEAYLRQLRQSAALARD